MVLIQEFKAELTASKFGYSLAPRSFIIMKKSDSFCEFTDTK